MRIGPGIRAAGVTHPKSLGGCKQLESGKWASSPAPLLLSSFHEMAIYDVPAMVNFILQHTGQEKLFYIGHAQGNSLGEWEQGAGCAKSLLCVMPYSIFRYAPLPLLFQQKFVQRKRSPVPIYPSSELLVKSPSEGSLSNNKKNISTRSRVRDILSQTRHFDIYGTIVAAGVIVMISCCFSGFIAFSSMPHLAEKIRLFFALAPLYTFHHVKGPVLKIAFLPDALLKVW